MNDNGLSSLLLKMISLEEQPQVAIMAANVMSTLLVENNYVQQSILEKMKANGNNFQFFNFIKTKLVESSKKMKTQI